MDVFWTKGFEGASLTELTAAMGIARPSLYAVFGSKEELFRKVLDLYGDENMAYVQHALTAPTARTVAQELLNGTLANCTAEGRPRGCLAIICSTACSSAAEEIRRDVLARCARLMDLITRRIERAVFEGDFSVSVDARTIADYLASVGHGIAIAAGGGASRDDLQNVVDVALGTWPGR
jgi:AcrR family transcriptional regulator